MKSALLTGANGFLGKYIHQSLKQFYTVDTLGLNRQNTFITDLAKDEPTLNKPYELVVHAAAHAHHLAAMTDEDIFALNRDGTQRICRAIDKLRSYPRHFIFISSVAVYGLQHGENISEAHPLNGYTAYALSKIQAEKIVEEWCMAHGVVYTILRLPLIAGPGAPGNIAGMVKAIKNNRYFIIGKGNAKKSLVLAQDVADLVAAIPPVQGIFHLTDGRHPSLMAFTTLMARQLHKRIPPALPPWFCKMLAAIGDLAGRRSPFNSRVLKQLTGTLTFDDSSAKKMLGWDPKPVLENLAVTDEINGD